MNAHLVCKIVYAVNSSYIYQECYMCQMLFHSTDDTVLNNSWPSSRLYKEEIYILTELIMYIITG